MSCFAEYSKTIKNQFDDFETYLKVLKTNVPVNKSDLLTGMEKLAQIDMRFIDFKRYNNLIKHDLFIGDYLVKINKYKLLVNKFYAYIKSFNDLALSQQMEFHPVITNKNYITRLNHFLMEAKRMITKPLTLLHSKETEKSKLLEETVNLQKDQENQKQHLFMKGGPKKALPPKSIPQVSSVGVMPPRLANPECGLATLPPPPKPTSIWYKSRRDSFPLEDVPNPKTKESAKTRDNFENGEAFDNVEIESERESFQTTEALHQDDWNKKNNCCTLS